MHTARISTKPESLLQAPCFPSAQLPSRDLPPPRTSLLLTLLTLTLSFTGWEGASPDWHFVKQSNSMVEPWSFLPGSSFNSHHCHMGKLGLSAPTGGVLERREEGCEVKAFGMPWKRHISRPITAIIRKRFDAKEACIGIAEKQLWKWKRSQREREFSRCSDSYLQGQLN